jgi:hypothetical protein
MNNEEIIKYFVRLLKICNSEKKQWTHPAYTNGSERLDELRKLRQIVNVTECTTENYLCLRRGAIQLRKATQ